jgi:hypothetical protein
MELLMRIRYGPFQMGLCRRRPQCSEEAPSPDELRNVRTYALFGRDRTSTVSLTAFDRSLRASGFSNGCELDMMKKGCSGLHVGSGSRRSVWTLFLSKESGQVHQPVSDLAAGTRERIKLPYMTTSYYL